MNEYDQIKELGDTKFRRLTGVKRATFNKMVEILKDADQQKKNNKAPLRALCFGICANNTLKSITHIPSIAKIDYLSSSFFNILDCSSIFLSNLSWLFSISSISSWVLVTSFSS